MRKLNFKKGIVPLLGLAMSLFTTAVSAQMTSAKIAINGTAVKTNPYVLDKYEGESLTEISVIVTGGNATGTVYNWKKDGVAQPALTSSSITINPLSISDSGTYTCTVTRANSTTDPTTKTLDADSSVRVVYHAMNALPSKNLSFKAGSGSGVVNIVPGVTYQALEGLLGNQGTKLQISDSAGSGPTGTNRAGKVTSVTWYKNGKQVVAGSDGFVAADMSWTASSLAGFLQLTTANTTLSTDPRGDAYYCKLSNNIGDTYTDTIFVKVYSNGLVPVQVNLDGVPTAPDPTAIFRDTVMIGSKSGAISVSANNAITYQWYRGQYKNGTPIANATSSSYKPASGWTADMADTYYVKMVNGQMSNPNAAVGYCNPIALAVVDGKGIIADVPTGNNTLPEMDTLRLTAAARGVKVLGSNYKWYRSGTLISGQTSATMAVPFTSIKDTGSYTYKAYNEVDSSALSGAAIVTITREPLPIFHNLKDVYDGTTNLITSSMGLNVKGEGSENLTVWSIIYASGTATDVKTYTVPGGQGRKAYNLAPATGSALTAGKYKLRVTSADGTLVLEKAFEIK